MLNSYYKYKLSYPNYLLLFKIGNFYLSFNDDAIIIHKLMNYSIKDTNKYLKTGFPYNSIRKIEAILSANKVNYCIIKSNNIFNHKFIDNTYSNYQLIIDNYYIVKNKIKHINKLLNQRLDYINILPLLDNVEKIIYEG